MRPMTTPATFMAALIVLFVLQPVRAVDIGAFDAGRQNRSGLTFSPDGKTAFWVEWDGRWGSNDRGPQRIYMSSRAGEGWTAPRPAPFSGEHSDSDPFVSPDGQWLYFVSDRPRARRSTATDDDIWRFHLAEPDRMEHLTVNSPAAEYSPVAVASGALYFASAREGGAGRGDLYRAAAADGGFAAPVILGPAVNSPTGEWNLWVSADERDLIFEASSRPTNVSIPGDLYYSWYTPAGWTGAVAISALNGDGSDLMPRLHADGATLLYTTAPIGGHARIVTARWERLRPALRETYAPMLLVANRSSHDVSFVDLARGEIVADVATGEGPHLLSNVHRGVIVATGYGEFPQPHEQPVSHRPPFVRALNAKLTVIDVAGREAILERKIDGCARPHASWIVESSAYVTCEDEKQIAAVDLATGAVVRRFQTQQDGSHVIRFDAASATLGVSNTGSGSLTLIGVADGATRVVDLPAGSEGLMAHGARFWVTNALHGSVSVVDPTDASVEKQIDGVCGFPIALSAARDDTVWVACFGSAELVELRADTGAVARRYRLGDQPLHLIVHPARALAYVSYPRRNAIGEIDLDSGLEIRRIDVGIEPDGLRWAAP